MTPPRAQQAAAEEATEAAQVEKAAVEPPQREKAERARQMKRQATPAEAQPPAAAVEERAPAKPKPQPTRPEQFAWAFPEEVPEQLLGKPMHHAPAVDSSGRIYLHTGGRLAALEESQGLPKICWEYSTGSHAPGPVTVAPDGNIRVHCSDGLLHCVSPEGKQIHMPARVGEPLGYAVPATDQAGNTWISAYDGGLIKIDADGRVQTSPRYFRSRRRFDAPGVIHQGVLYIGSEEGYTFAIRLDDRRGTNLWNHAAEQGHTGWYVHSWPAITEDGVLVMAGREEHLYGFAPDGRTLWKTDVSGQMLGSPVIDRHGQIYVGVSHWQRGRQPQGRLVCVDGNSHKIRWHYQADGPVESTPVIGDDDLLYFGDNSGVIHAIDLRGDPHWKAHVGAAVRSAGTILAARRLAFGLDDETLIVLTCSSQRLAQTAWPRIGCTLGQCGLSC